MDLMLIYILIHILITMYILLDLLELMVTHRYRVKKLMLIINHYMSILCTKYRNTKFLFPRVYSLN